MPPRQDVRSGVVISLTDSVLCVSSSLNEYLCLIWFIEQFRDSGCENCPFFKMEEDHDRIVDATTPNFNGYDLNSNFFCIYSSLTVHKSIFGTLGYMENLESW